ncbi:hypothetical protein ACC739_37925, partial [Rhizobium ruizarguesonis]
LAESRDGLQFRQFADASPGKQPAGKEQQEESPRLRALVAGSLLAGILVAIVGVAAKIVDRAMGGRPA